LKEELYFANNGGHHPARASKATMSKTADRVLGVHGFVLPWYCSVVGIVLVVLLF
jgi:hypothetical protein